MPGCTSPKVDPRLGSFALLCSAVIRDWAHNGEAGGWHRVRGQHCGHWQLYTLACLNCDIDTAINTHYVYRLKKLREQWKIESRQGNFQLSTVYWCLPPCRGGVAACLWRWGRGTSSCTWWRRGWGPPAPPPHSAWRWTDSSSAEIETHCYKHGLAIHTINADNIFIGRLDKIIPSIPLL